jgi:enamine deaminase RidA (YjgF/YER057c/UK114 family)
MIRDRLNPEGLLSIPQMANVTIASGTRFIHVSGQNGVDADGRIVGPTHYEQACRALENVRTALAAAGASLEDIARMNIYVVDHGDRALNALITAAVDTYGNDYPVTAGTLLGVASLWQEGLLIEIDALAVI